VPLRIIPPAALLALALAVPVASASNALNGRIAYTTHAEPTNNGQGEIYTIDPDGSHPFRLNENPGSDAQSDWAPDGLDLLYRSSPGSGGFEVWRMTQYGGNETRLTFSQDLPADQRYSSSQPAWFPDRSRLLFRASGGPYGVSPVLAMAPAPGAPIQLVLRDPQHSLWYPTLSPDMTRLLVARQYTPPPEDRAVEVANGTGRETWDSLFTGQIQQLFNGAVSNPAWAYDSAGAWSPDGTQIAFESNIDGDMDVYVMNADGTNVRQLTGVEPDNDAHDEGPAWSPDARQMAFTSGPDNLHGDIHVMNVDGSNVRRLTFNEDPQPNRARDESPDWQPVPIGEDLRALGDVVDSGPGAYSVHARGRLRDAHALWLAGLWADLANRGRPPKRLGDFVFRTERAGYGALIVRGERRDKRRGWRHPRENTRIVFLYRGA
jgi:dipeptidyl aminopeptidase/acylaminoacyl peptidase